MTRHLMAAPHRWPRGNCVPSDRSSHYRLDRGHPLCQNLLWFSVTASDRDVVRNRVWTPTSGVFQTRYGLARGGNGLELAANADTDELAFTSGGWAVGALVVVNSMPTSSYPYLFSRHSYTSETVNSGWALYHDSVAGTFQGAAFGNVGAATYAVGGTTVAQAGIPYLVVMTTPGSSFRRLYVNGVREGSNTARFNPSSTSTGVRHDGNSGSVQISVIATYAWGRNLGEWEISHLARDPFALLL